MSKHPANYCPAFGNYPAEYNRAKHGPYYPFVDYRPNQDVPLKDVKLGEFKAWFMRRDKTPQAIIAATSRTVHYWSWRWQNTRYGSYSKPVLQVLCLSSFIAWLAGRKVWKAHRNHKYHW